MPVVIPPFANVPAPGDGIKSDWAQQLTQYTVDHVNDAADAHDASAISVTPVGTISSTDVQSALAELANEGSVDLTNHLNDATDAHDASAISFVPTGSIAATNVQAALAEVAAEGVVPDGSINTAKLVDGAVTNLKQAPVNSPILKGRISAGVGQPEDMTPAQARTVLAADDGNAAHVLRGDGSWGVPPATQATAGGADRSVQYNKAGVIDGAGAVEVSTDGHLLLKGSALPNPWAVTDRSKLQEVTVGVRSLPFMIHPHGRPALVPPGGWCHQGIVPVMNGTAMGVLGFQATPTATGTATAVAPSGTNLFSRGRRIEYQQNSAATSNVAGLVHAQPVGVIPDGTGGGGLIASMRWGPALGTTVATARAFCGLTAFATAPVDANPSSIQNVIGMGWDSGDQYVSIIHRGTAGANKIPLSAVVGAFPRPTSDRTQVYELILYLPFGAQQEVNWLAINHTNKESQTGAFTTDNPMLMMLYPRTWQSVGGSSALIGVAVFGWDFYTAL